MKAENFYVKNQFVIHTKKAIIFQSYETPIAVYIRDTNTVYVSNKKYSRTTSKYTKLFLEEYAEADVHSVNADTMEMLVEEI